MTVKNIFILHAVALAVAGEAGAERVRGDATACIRQGTCIKLLGQIDAGESSRENRQAMHASIHHMCSPIALDCALVSGPVS